jgi:hypothetical protein
MARVLPVSSSDLIHLFQPSLATPNPLRGRMSRFRRLRHRGGSSAGHRAVNPSRLISTVHLRSDGPDLWILVRIHALYPWAPPVNCVRTLALGPTGQPVFPPQSLTALAHLLALAHAPVPALTLRSNVSH